MISILGSIFPLDVAIVLDDIPRLYTAVAEWLACTVFILLIKKRFSNVKQVLLSIVFGVLQCLWHVFVDTLDLIFWVPGMAIAVGLMFLYIFASCKVSSHEAGYHTMHAFILAEFIASIEWQFEYYINELITLPVIVRVLFMMLVFGTFFVIAYFMERRHINLFEIGIKDFLMFMLMAIIIFAGSNVSFISSDTPISGTYPNAVFYIRTLVDLCGVFVMYTLEAQRIAQHALREADTIQNIVERQYEQYCQSKENIELINRRCHDFKHQITAIRQELDLEKRSQYLDEMEYDIKQFDMRYDTGNGVLDVILTGKGRICDDKKILFTCVADGKVLNFMDTMDICSLFGNALDNAIESLQTIDDENKRLLKLAVYTQNNCAIVKIENYFQHKLKMVDNNYVSTKNKSEGHGFGLKSIIHVSEKYGGNATINTTDNWFTLCVLIPLPEVK